MIRFIFLMIFYSFSSVINSIIGQQLPVLNISDAFNKPGKITLTDFVENLEYVKLQTSPECFIGSNPDIKVTKDFIIVTTIRNCLAFDRRSGNFIREIGHYGKGPGEYQSTRGVFNELSLVYYFSGWNGNLLRYSLAGVFQGTVKIPEYNEGFKAPSFPDVYSYLDEKTLVCNFAIFSGTEDKSIMIFRDDGDVIKTFPNKEVLKTKQKIVYISKETKFHRFNNNLYFQNRYNDTVFKLTQNQIIPYMVLFRGKYRPSFASRWLPFEKQDLSKFISQPVYFENNRFISFNFHLGTDQFFVLCDKLHNSIKITKNDSGIINDIDGFVNITFKSINNSGELISIVQPNEIIEWFGKNSERLGAMKSELKSFGSVKIEDNPIIIIGKYK
jgi:hypothetical protein